MIGELYIIRNIINNKVYIGKTYIGIHERWKTHIKDSVKCDTKFYRAIRKYGKENFHIDLLGKYESGVLEQKEIEYIKIYDSYRNGYNSTLGGEGNLKIEYEVDNIVSMYKSGCSMQEIKEYYNFGTIRSIAKILRNAGFKIEAQTSLFVEQYSKDGKLLRTFTSKMEMYKWLVSNVNANLKRSTAYYYSKKASESGGIFLGFRWKIYNTDTVIKRGDKHNAYIHVAVYDTDDKLLIESDNIYDVYCTLLHYVNNLKYKDIYDIFRSNMKYKYGLRFEYC